MVGTGIFFNRITRCPAIRPINNAPRKPALVDLPFTVWGSPAINPPTRPGTNPGRPAIPKAMKPANTAGNNLNAVVPIVSRSATTAGALVKSGPEGDIGTNAIERAIRMPPHAISGITYETPVNRYCLCFCNNSFMDKHDYRGRSSGASACPSLHCTARLRNVKIVAFLVFLCCSVYMLKPWQRRGLRSSVSPYGALFNRMNECFGTDKTLGYNNTLKGIIFILLHF